MLPLRLTTLPLLLTSLAWPSLSYGRSKREGFNFGIKSAAIEGTSLSMDQDTTKSNTKTTSSSANPYVGYVVLDWLNLGLNANTETYTSEERLSSASESSETYQIRESKLNSGSFFARFLFARILYFEGGFGIYRKTLTIHNEISYGREDGSFNGRESNFANSGMGPGYHVAAGMEFPVAYGFFFTSAYTNRIYQLRTEGGNSGLEGKKIGREMKRDVSFGIAYYYQD